MESVLFIVGLVLIELGFISFVLISLFTLEYGFSELRNSLLIGFGIILLILGIISMYFYGKERNTATQDCVEGDFLRELSG